MGWDIIVQFYKVFSSVIWQIAYWQPVPCQYYCHSDGVPNSLSLNITTFTVTFYGTWDIHTVAQGVPCQYCCHPGGAPEQSGLPSQQLLELQSSL